MFIKINKRAGAHNGKPEAMNAQKTINKLQGGMNEVLSELRRIMAQCEMSEHAESLINSLVSNNEHMISLAPSNCDNCGGKTRGFRELLGEDHLCHKCQKSK